MEALPDRLNLLGALAVRLNHLEAIADSPMEALPDPWCSQDTAIVMVSMFL